MALNKWHRCRCYFQFILDFYIPPIVPLFLDHFIGLWNRQLVILAEKNFLSLLFEDFNPILFIGNKNRIFILIGEQNQMKISKSSLY